MKLIAEPLTTDGFTPFGQVITAPNTYGRQTFTGSLAHADRPPVLSTTHTPARPAPFIIDRLERHPHSSQTFLPLDVGRWLIVAAAAADSSQVRAFVADGTTGVTIGRGIWHGSLTALDRDASFAVMMWKNDAPDDDDWATVTPLTIEVPPAT